ncbi:MAG: TCR/Tet family MFS transporter [Phenylobacterium sp.]|uniref:TCR/Tet family MFS transporter n=1 Tax=Phenylobacterium sp. TaxID=1871053 RepID=UPI001A42D32E|nr:TCR/Tet family MFS transporter [Phenylobacterium sp.]MBL8553194.1 TCR/Tet family MFS transporter [Phenylobacterium sp.]
MSEGRPAGAGERGLRAFAGGRAAVGFVLVSVWLDVLSLGVIIPVYAPLVQQFQGGDAGSAARWNGVLSTLWAASQFIAAPVLGALSDRFGRRPVLLISLFGLALDYLVMVVAPNLWWLVATRIVAGLTAGGMGAANAYIADVTAPEKRAQTFGLIGAAWGVGFIVGPAIGGFLAHNWGLRAPFVGAGALTLLGVVYGFFVLPESLKPENRAAFDWKKANPVGSLRFLAQRREVLALSTMNLLLQTAHYVLPTIFVLYASNRYGWTPDMTGYALALTGICNIVVQGVLVKPVVAKIGEWGAVLAGLTFGGLGFAIYGMAPTGWLFLAGTPVFGLIGLFGPGFQGLVTRRVAASEQGRLQGANASAAGLAGIVAPAVFGFTYAWFVTPGHPQVPGSAFFLAAGLHAVAVCIAIAVMARAPRATGAPA